MEYKKETNLYGMAAIHNHSYFSLDSTDSPEELVETAAQHGFNVLVLTDHETTRGTKRAVREGNLLGVEVIPGTETTPGIIAPHLIGINIENHIKSGRGNDWTAREIKKQGGYTVFPHPGAYLFYSEEIIRLIEEGLLDGLEIINGKISYFPHRLRNYLDSQSQKVVAEMGGADSHFAKADILSSSTLFPGKTAADFFKAIEEKTTIPIRGPQLSWSLRRKVRSFYGGLIKLSIRRLCNSE